MGHFFQCLPRYLTDTSVYILRTVITVYLCDDYFESFSTRLQVCRVDNLGCEVFKVLFKAFPLLIPIGIPRITECFQRSFRAFPVEQYLYIVRKREKER